MDDRFVLRLSGYSETVTHALGNQNARTEPREMSRSRLTTRATRCESAATLGVAAVFGA